MGTKSFFRHYISNLPVGVPGIPLFFSQEAIKALEEYPPLRYVYAAPLSSDAAYIALTR